MTTDIYSRAPVNKLAAVVTNQSNCASDDTLSDEQLRENLVAQIKVTDTKIQTLPKNHFLRKELGQKKQQLQNQINKLRPKKKAPGVEHHFIDVCREELTKPHFDILMRKAVERLKGEDK